jgi:hypothetical protein
MTGTGIVCNNTSGLASWLRANAQMQTKRSEKKYRARLRFIDSS